MSYLLEGDPPIQVDPSVGNLYEGSLGGVTGVGGDPPPGPSAGRENLDLVQNSKETFLVWSLSPKNNLYKKILF